MSEETTKSAPATDEIISRTTEIVSAFVSNNPIPAGDVPGFIATVHSMLKTLSSPSEVAPETVQQPAVNPKKSITPDYLISLEDGKQYRTLKRHLTAHGMTPDEYREKWSLPFDYPMVAPSYAAARSVMAKEIGLGRKSGNNTAAKRAVERGRPKRS
ncbi:Ros/MucR family transcriptional regulator [Aliihoeflea sp. PC F10.4]